MLSMLGPKNFQVVRSINHLSMPCSGVSFNQRHGSIHGYQRHVLRHCTIYKRSPLLTSLHSTCQELNRSPPSNNQELLFDLVPSSLIHSYILFLNTYSLVNLLSFEECTSAKYILNSPIWRWASLAILVRPHMMRGALPLPIWYWSLARRRRKKDKMITDAKLLAGN